MRKIVITFGCIAGVILAFMLLLSATVFKDNPEVSGNELFGYAMMVIALSTIFFGVKTYRDRHLQGKISFGKAFRMGLYITLIASALYVITWMVVSDVFYPDFIEDYAQHQLAELQAQGASAGEISATEAQMDKYRRMYSNPLLKAGITFTEIFPVGLIIALISAAIIRRK